jgi:hypothetical protein
VVGCEYGRGIPPDTYKVSIAPPVPSPFDAKAGIHPDYHYIPQRYRDFGTTDLAAAVSADGQNNFPFDMKK